jgi:hypothetical protein
MKRLCVFMLVFLLSVFCFAQQNAGIKVIGRIPDAGDTRLYQLQVGSFRVICNAENAFERLRAASLNPSYEKYGDLTRVLIKGVSGRIVRSCIELIRRAGFSEVLVKLDGTAGRQPSAGRQPAASRQPSTSRQPSEEEYDDSEDSYSESQSEEPQNNGSGNFPKTGTWKLTGRDPEGTEWKADIVIKNVRGTNFDGYFDWYMGPDFDNNGKEYFTGRFDTISEKIYFQGTRLENGRNLSLGKYEAYVSINRDEFYNGRWEEPEGIPTSDWQAKRED